jgi:hypothetical protein
MTERERPAPSLTERETCDLDGRVGEIGGKIEATLTTYDLNYREGREGREILMIEKEREHPLALAS